MNAKTKKKTTKKTAKKSTKKKATKTKTTEDKDVIVGKTLNEVKTSTKKTAFELAVTRSKPNNRIIQEKREALQDQRVYQNLDKRKIAIDILERYTGHRLSEFQDQIILTNFHYYMERFNFLLSDAKYTEGSAFKASSSKRARVTIIEFGLGSAMAALIMEVVAVIEPKAVLFLGMCGAVHPSLKVGDFILPIAAIRAEGVSTHFMPPQVPALPTFKVQKFVSQILVEHGHDYRTGTVHSTDLRFWEFDQSFIQNLLRERVLAVEMETAALFVTGFASKVSIGALLLVSDCPLKRGGIKTKKSAKQVFSKYTDIHIELGIEIMADIAERGETIRHYRW